MTNLTLALQITAVGMGLVFTAILILWMTMILLTKLTADASPPPGASASHPTAPDRVAETELLARARGDRRGFGDRRTTIIVSPSIGRTAHGDHFRLAIGHADETNYGKRRKTQVTMKYNVTIQDKSYVVESEDINARPVIAYVEGIRFETLPAKRT